MARFNVTRSAMRLSAVFVAAGTILGVASGAAAQSRLERAERELQKAQRELEQARAEAGRAEGGQREIRVQVNTEGQCEGACDGCADCDAQGGQNEVSVTAGDDDDDEQPGQKRIERRIEVRRGGGEGQPGHPGTCPLCGGPMKGDLFQKMPQGAMTLRAPHGLSGSGQNQFKVFGLGGGGGGGKGGENVRVFRMGGPEGGEGGGWSTGPHTEVHSFGKAIVIGPDGKRQEFNFGGGGGDKGGNKQERKVIRLRGMDGGGGGEGGEHEMKIEGLPHGMDLFHGEGFPMGEGQGFGQGGGSGTIIIVGPDGQRQEFNFGGGQGGGQGQNGGGDQGGKAKKRRIEIQEESGDGEAPHAHLRSGAAGGQRTITVRKVSPAI